LPACTWEAAEHSDRHLKAELMAKARRAVRNVLRDSAVFLTGLPETLRLRGVCDWMGMKQEKAQKYWQHGISPAQDLGMHYQLELTQLKMGRRLDDREHLEQAESICADIGAEFDLAETRKLLGVGHA